MEKDMDADMDDKKDGDEDMEDRVVDLEDALDELKAEFEQMMAKKDDDDDDKEDESLEMPAETPVEAEIPMEAMHKDKKDMKKEAMHDKKDKKKMDEYKIQKSANNSDMSDKSAKGATPSVGGAKEKLARLLLNQVVMKKEDQHQQLKKWVSLRTVQAKIKHLQ